MTEMDVAPVSHEELAEDIRDAYECRTPLFVWGRTGIGKSHTIKRVAMELAEREGRKFTTRMSEIDGEHFFLLDRRLTYMNPTDLVGVLYKTNGVSKWHFPDWVYAISKQREEEEGIEVKGIVSLEELNLAPPLVQNAAYELVLDHRIHGLEIAEGVTFVAAGNVAEDRAFTFEMPDPLKTRFTHVELQVPIFKHPEKKEGWFYWAVENGVDGRILSFLSFRQDLLFRYIEEARAFPTPRGWEIASRLMKNKNDRMAWRAVAKACGNYAGLQFKQFMELSASIDLEDLLKNPRKFNELDVANRFAAIAALSSAYSRNPDHYAEKLLKFAVTLFTGIYDEVKLREYAEKVLELYGKKEGEEELRKMRGDRQAEFATLILSNMKAQNDQALKNVVENSVYGNVIVDIIPFLL